MCSSMESDTGVTSKLDDPLKVNDADGRLNSTNSSVLLLQMPDLISKSQVRWVQLSQVTS